MKRLLILLGIGGVVAYVALRSDSLPSYEPPEWVDRHDGSLVDLLEEFYIRRDWGYDKLLVRKRIKEIAAAVQPADAPRDRAVALGVLLAKSMTELGPKLQCRPDRVLPQFRGNCVGRVTAFLLVAERLRLDAHMVLIPDPPHAIVETYGELYDLGSAFRPVRDDKRREWMSVGSKQRYGARLSRREVVAVHAETLAGRLIRSNRATAAWPMFELALALDSNSAVAHYGLAARALGADNLDIAALHADRAVSLNPLSEKGHMLKAVIARERGNLDEYAHAASKAERLSGKTFEELLPD